MVNNIIFSFSGYLSSATASINYLLLVTMIIFMSTIYSCPLRTTTKTYKHLQLLHSTISLLVQMATWIWFLYSFVQTTQQKCMGNSREAINSHFHKYSKIDVDTSRLYNTEVSTICISCVSRMISICKHADFFRLLHQPMRKMIITLSSNKVRCLKSFLASRLHRFLPTNNTFTYVK